MIDAAYALRHSLWATRRILEHAATLTQAQLALTVPGTAGSIRYNLAHIVGADQRYLKRLGVEPGTSLAEADEPDVAGITAAHAANEEGWARVIAETPDLEAWVPLSEGRVRRVVMPAQAIHHGTDHRTQIGTILLHHALDCPELDVWTYGGEVGDGEYEEG
ncbi:MAG: DinB family protein [Candidatus Dormibacterales bacterium]